MKSKATLTETLRNYISLISIAAISRISERQFRKIVVYLSIDTYAFITKNNNHYNDNDKLLLLVRRRRSLFCVSSSIKANKLRDWQFLLSPTAHQMIIFVDDQPNDRNLTVLMHSIEQKKIHYDSSKQVFYSRKIV